MSLSYLSSKSNLKLMFKVWCLEEFASGKGVQL